MIFKHSKEKTWLVAFISDRGNYHTYQVKVVPKVWSGPEATVKSGYQKQKWMLLAPTELLFWKD
jgi:hypothetical protein